MTPLKPIVSSASSFSATAAAHLDPSIPPGPSAPGPSAPGPSAPRYGCTAVLVRPPPASDPTGRVSEAFQKRSVLPAGSQFLLIWAYFLDRLLCTDRVNNNCNIPVINHMSQRCVAVF